MVTSPAKRVRVEQVDRSSKRAFLTARDQVRQGPREGSQA